jgi:branched-chain amino acid transport system substrate-binding protein
MRKIWLFVVLASVFMVVSLLSLPSIAAETQVIKIGAVNSLTGFMAAGESPGDPGMKIAVDWINDKGGITVKGAKYKLQLIAEDSKSSAEGMSAACIKLVEKDKVKFILGGVNPMMNIAASSVTEPANVMRMVSYIVGNPEEAGPKFPLTFFANANMQGARALLTWIKETYPNVKTLAFPHPGEGGGVDSRRKNIEPIANQLGMTVVFSEEFPGDTVDYTAYVKKGLATNPDAWVFTDGWAYMVAAQTKVLRRLGYKGPIASIDPMIVSEVLQLAGPELSEGYASASWEMFSPHMTPVFKKDFLPRVMKTGNPNAWMVWGFNDAWAVAQAIESAQSLDPVVVAKHLRTMKKVETLFGPATLGGEKTFGIKSALCPPQAIFVAKKGKPEFVKWVQTETP